MRKPSLRGTAAALATLALCGAGPAAVTVTGGPAAASAAATARITPAAACTSATKGVTVVVDFAWLKRTRKVKVGCDPHNPKNGLAALKGAGFTYLLSRQYPGFVCRIDGLGVRAGHKCPGPRAYWSYWHAKRHGHWIFSKVGANSYHPKPGSVQGWRWEVGKKPPRIPPP